MVRATYSVPSHKRKKRLYKRAKGFWGDRKNHLRLTEDAVMKGDAFSFMHRRKKKGDFRALWITRLNAAAKINGISYSKLIDGLKKASCTLNRKTLSELAIKAPKVFAEVANKAKSALKTT